MELAALAPIVEVAGVRQAVEHRGHPVGELLRSPHPGRGHACRTRPGSSFRADGPLQHLGQDAHVASARFSPLAPVGGTVWAASPASRRRPPEHGFWTKLRNGRTVWSVTCPSCKV